MFHPAVLEAKFEGAHISCGNQLAWFDAQVGGDALNDLLAFAHLHPPGGAKGQVVGPKRGASKA